ncbi:2Fe-2S iron-sulfur cluster-binding protein [Streptomyces sp. NPDC048623]|uniref:(2Fe-2S)-binding protein n=1 Tax=Streptomyces sp. NPDC048623 TaxID=3155761 RepID=UPI003422E5E9
MSDEAQGNPGNRGTGGWEPIPQSEGYDGDATAFVQLPPEFMLEGTPLAAPGHGYVPPPMIVPLTPAAATDPSATGTWAVQPPVPAEPIGYETGGGYETGDGYEAEQGYEGERGYEAQQRYEGGAAGYAAAGYDAAPDPGATGQWTIPTIEDGAEALDDSGEYTASSLSQYASSASATLPGGAPAPWADAFREPEPEPRQAPEAMAEPVPDLVPEPEPQPDPQPEQPERPEPEFAGQAEADDPVTEPEAELVPAQAQPREDLLPPVAPVPTGMSVDSDEHPTTSYTLRVNGADRPVTESWIGESLLYVLRERLGLAGAKDGCSQGECGACNVQVDGRLVASCLVPAATAAGSEVRTVEGLAVDGEPSDVQRALAKCGVQCGFCIPGMAMTVHDLLEGNHAPTELETRQALCGNLCRCSGYRGVLDAVREIAAGRGAAPAGGEHPAAGGEGGAFGADADAAARIPHQIPHPHDGGMA